jgi:YVTN family beta-propeller protein
VALIKLFSFSPFFHFMFQVRLSAFFTRTLLTGFGAIALFGCDPDSDGPGGVPSPAGTGANVYIVNEGQFNTPNGAISLFSKTSNTVVDNNLFTSVNGRPLGDVVQSMTVVGDRGYVVVNATGKLEVVTMSDFRQVATIEQLQQPRYLIAVNAEKAYLTEWVQRGAAGRVAVIDLRTNTVTKTIPVGRQPERLLLANGKVYVTNSDENTVSVINPSSDVVENTIQVVDGPSSLVQDNSGNVWVACTGITRYASTPPYNVLSSTNGALVRFNPGNSAAVTTLPFTSGGPSDLTTNGTKDQLYYNYRGGVYQLAVGATTLPTTPLIRRSFYGLGVDPQNNTIYGSIAPFTTTGKVIRYQRSGAAIDSFGVNIGPNSFIFY